MAKTEIKKKNNSKKQQSTNKKENKTEKSKSNNKKDITINKKEKNNEIIKNDKKQKLINLIKNKYIVFGIVAVIILILVITLIAINSKINNEPIEMKDAISIINYRKISTKKSKNSIYKKYKLEKYTMREAKNDVSVYGINGKILFLRSNNINANIFQTKRMITPMDPNGKPALSQVNENINYLKSEALSYIGIDKNAKPIEETLSGKSNSKYKLPLRESIYIEKREYSATYLGSDGNKYDLNFYMDGDYLVCEFVKFLDLDKKEKK